MFRFIHAADIHLDSPLRGLAAYETAPVEAFRNASRRAFENLVDLALEEAVSFVLLAGDLYDGDWKDFNTGIFMSHQLGRLKRAGIRVLAVAGNHDATSQLTKAMELPENMTFFSTSKPGSQDLDDLPVVVHGQGFKTRSVTDNIAARFPDAVPGVFNIGLLHTSLDGREGLSDYAPCSVADLRARGYQYWALGHSHDFEVVDEEPRIVFAGCLQGRNIRERGAKGCVLVTVEDGAITALEHRALDVVRWALCSVDLSEVEQLVELRDRARDRLISIEEVAEGRPTAARVVFEGATPLASEIRTNAIVLEQQIRALAAEIGDERFWVEKVRFEVTGPRTVGQDDDGTVGQMLSELTAEVRDAGDIDGLEDVVAAIRQKLPFEAAAPGAGLELEDPRCLARLIAEAKDLLLGRLLTEGGRK